MPSATFVAPASELVIPSAACSAGLRVAAGSRIAPADRCVGGGADQAVAASRHHRTGQGDTDGRAQFAGVSLTAEPTP